MQKDKKFVVSFPHIGNYYIPIYNLLKKLIDEETTRILIPEKMSKNTIDVGSKSSPEFICIPFKYNMGNYIESLNRGANVLIQAGGGCRYGYYAEIQEQILRDMGYKFTYITLLDPEGINILNVYHKFHSINPKLKLKDFVSYFLFTIKVIHILDEFETYIRENMVFEKEKGNLEKIHQSFLEELKNVNSYKELYFIKNKYFKLAKSVRKEDNQENYIKIGIVGELYTSMEPFSSLFLEKELATMGCLTKRYTTVTYLLFEKGKAQNKLLNKASKYVNYALGADGLESIAHTLELINDGYDGIIHIKPFGCTPEINAMPILQKISQDENIPIIYFTFDSQTSEVGIKTRLEAFYDMLVMRKENLNRNGREIYG
ncbi:MAG: 2-hydroxyacyl-CoA dehydratase [Clostridia bacterium]|nr:2-hydroxyacyl-CoA dehydratase [Clostridia bacterium]